jgi:Sortase domain
VTEIKVTRADRSSARFVVERTAQDDKQQFPTDDVYYPTLTPALRLVTCGGQFDHSTGHYRSNIIVFAHAQDLTAPVQGVRSSHWSTICR